MTRSERVGAHPQMEKQKAVFNELVVRACAVLDSGCTARARLTARVLCAQSHITEKCFEKCVPKPGNKLDSSEQACLSQCTLRFLESNQVILQRLQRSAK